MNMTEFLKVKEMTYSEYCDYLQRKYGIGRSDYMTKSFYRNKKCSRTSEGLIAHHKAEDKMILLSTRVFAKKCPYEWQQKENIVYCDYLEHLLLHVLICKYPSSEAGVGIGGVISYIAPELNDLYSGWITKEAWRLNCHSIVKDDKDVYLAILKLFAEFCKKEHAFDVGMLHTSFNESFGGWSKEKNKGLFEEIDRVWELA